MKKLLIFGMVFLLFTPWKVNAQIYDLLSFDDGVFGIRKEGQTLRYFLTDENLDIKHQGNIDFKEPILKIRYKSKGNKVFVLVNYTVENNFLKAFMMVDAVTGETAFWPVQTTLKNVGDFYILENKIALFGYFGNNFSIIQLADTQEEGTGLSSTTIPYKILDYAGSEGLLDILINKGNDQLQLLTMDEAGEIVLTIDLRTKFDPKHEIVSASLQKNEDGKFRVVGTYAHKRKRQHLGYYVWEMDYTLDQQFRLYPTSSLQGFEKSSEKKINKQLKYEVTNGFKLVKTLEEDGKLTLVSIPRHPPLSKRVYPKVFNHHLFHILTLDDEGEVLSDQTFAFKRSLESPFAHLSQRMNPPIYLAHGRLYFMHNEEFTDKPSLIVQEIRSGRIQAADEINPLLPSKASIFYTRHFKDNQIVVFGIKDGIPEESDFFYGKVILE